MRKLKLVLGGLLVALASMTANAATINLNYTNGTDIVFDTSSATSQSSVGALTEFTFDVTVLTQLTTTDWLIYFVDNGTGLDVELFDNTATNLLRSASATNGGSPFSFQWNNLLAGDYKLKLTTGFPYASAEVSAVPVPAAALLFGTALLGFAGFSTRRKV